MKVKPIEFKVGEYTIRRDEYGRWYRLRLEREMSHPSCFKEYGFEKFEETIVIALAKALGLLED